MRVVDFPYLEPTRPLGGRERADKILEQIPLHPEDELVLYHELAFVCFAGVDHPMCEKACEYLIANGKTDEQIHDAYYLKASLAMEDPKRSDEAIMLFKQAIDAGIDPIAVYSKLGDIYLRKKLYDEAIRYYHLDIDTYLQDEDFEEAEDSMYASLAEAYFGKQDYLESLKYFEKAFQLNPESMDAICGIGRALADQGKIEEAMPWFERAIKMTPDDAYPYYYMGCLWERKSDFYRAMHFYTEALKRKPDFAEVYNNIGAIHINLEGDLKGALDNMMKALEAIGDDESNAFISMVYLNMSKLYKRIADYESADYYHNKFMQSLGFPTELDTDEGDDFSPEEN